MFSSRTDWKLQPNRFTQAYERIRATGREVLDLTASNPTRVSLVYNTPQILNALISEEAVKYEPAAKGLLRSRLAVAEYYQDRGVSVNPKAIILTTSTSEAYSYVFRLLCEPGDEVLVPVPSYPLFEFLANIQDVKLSPYPLFYDHGWHVDLHALEQKLTARSRAVLLVHPNNPTGSYVKEEEARRLSEICAGRQMALVADEVFLDFALDQNPRSTFAANGGCLTFTLSGLSKISGLPQMKVAWLVTSGPDPVACDAVARLEVIADTYLSMNAPIQHAIPTLLEQRFSIQRQLLDRIRLNLAELDRALTQQSACERLQIEGGWYAILRVPVTRSDEDLAIELLEEQSVLVHPGHFYDFPREGYLVLSLITPGERFRDGIGHVLERAAEK